MSEFTVGQKVTIEGNCGISAITTVAKIGALKMTLANGEEWKVNGRRRWASSGGSYYSGPYVRAHREGDEEALTRRENLEIAQCCQRWHLLPDEQLAVVAGFIRGLSKKEKSA